MSDRQGRSNIERFPYRYKDGKPVCRMCGKPNGRRTFCSARCLRDFFMLTDWQRVREVVYIRDGGICMICGKKVKHNNFHVDHIQPISKGGSEWDLANLECTCPKCNLSKGAKTE